MVVTRLAWLPFFWTFVFYALPNDPGFFDLSLEELANIQIQVAAKREQTQNQAPAIVTVITAEELAALPVQTIEDVLQMVAGFEPAQQALGGNLSFTVRGVKSLSFSANGIKYLLDGHMLTSLTGAPLHYFDYFPLDRIKRLEIIRGPGSALYGGNAFFGVINIITKDGEQHPVSAALTVGEFATVSPSINLTETVGHWAIQWAASYYETDGYKEPINNDFARLLFGEDASAVPTRTTIDADFFQTHLKLSRSSFSINVFHNRLNRNVPIGMIGAATDENHIDVNYSYAELGYKKKIREDRVTLSTAVYYNRYQIDQALELLSEASTPFINPNPDTPFPEDEGVVGKPIVTYADTGIEFSLDAKISDRFSLLAGLALNQSKIYAPLHRANANVTGVPLTIDGTLYLPNQYLGGFRDLHTLGGNWISPADRFNRALYTQAIWDLRALVQRAAKTLTLTTGLRYDDYDDVGSAASPRIGLVYGAKSGFFLKLLYGEAFRVPTFDELYQKNNPAIIGNPDLQPEQLTTYELQIGYQASRRFEVGLTLFEIDLKDNIQVINTLHTNADQIDSHGMEVEGRWMPTTKTSVRGNLSFNDVTRKQDQNGEIITFAPGYTADLLANLSFQHELNRSLQWACSVNHVGSRGRSEQTYLENGTRLPLDARPDTPSRTLLNTAFTARLSPQLGIKLQGFNLLDEHWRDPDQSGRLIDDVPRAGISYQVRFQYRY
ncbi:TonB-dependent receptor plug domain-containing protein [Acanthopleuribacter pedis]|uniref:TonB-dependent receptor n=1 Tax=Acanthopleuribacter pedis TaxID=442870 RepID=A0A8J7QQR2_9BACT|nr:TonB-dependent receptor [Acanthopleuribacter pedis]MBO1322763.1 TonB-dependent receptor [Acanthopleuribacter pedis]